MKISNTILTASMIFSMGFLIDQVEAKGKKRAANAPILHNAARRLGGGKKSHSITELPSPNPSSEYPSPTPSNGPSSAPSDSALDPTQSPTQSPTVAPTMSPTQSPVESRECCACTPATYTFELDLSANCDATSIGNSTGAIADVACLVEIREDESSEDPVPIEVESIQIFELNKALQVIGQVQLPNLDQVTGYQFDFSSRVNMPDLEDDSLPAGLQMVLTGLNAQEESVVNTWIILFTNDCGIAPALDATSDIGWVKIVNVTDPVDEYCPSLLPTIPATRAPTMLPTQSPTVSPTVAPTVSPTQSPTQSPTVAPTMSPTQSPVEPRECCACTPANYTFELDFTGDCATTTLAGTGNGAITETPACLIEKNGVEDVMNFVPVLVTSIQILELNKNLQVTGQLVINGAQSNGFRFDYSSVVNTPNLMDADLPRGLQVTLTGTNNLDQGITNTWAIIFDNTACGIVPVLAINDEIGWINIVDVTAPVDEYCP